MVSSPRLVDQFIGSIDSCPWGTCSGRSTPWDGSSHRTLDAPLYTAEEKRRRDASPWTMVQGVLAPVQFLIFLVSLFFVLRYLETGTGLGVATTSVVIKTMALYAIMITGSIWERDVFGQYLFAPAFFWEDVVSMLVLALHSLYVFALFTQILDAHALMMLALTAYGSYVVNAAQFILKLRAARKGEASWSGSHQGLVGASR